MVTLLAVMAVMDVWFFVHTEDLLVFNNKVNAYTVARLLVFVVLSSLFHGTGTRFGLQVFRHPPRGHRFQALPELSRALY